MVLVKLLIEIFDIAGSISMAGTIDMSSVYDEVSKSITNALDVTDAISWVHRSDTCFVSYDICFDNTIRAGVL